MSHTLRRRRLLVAIVPMWKIRIVTEAKAPTGIRAGQWMSSSNKKAGLSPAFLFMSSKKLYGVLTRWPAHRAAAEQMQMDMEYGLSAILIAIHYQSVA